MNKDILAPLIFAAGCFVFFLLDIPQYDKILDINAAINDSEALLADRTALREKTVELIGEYEKRKNEIEKLRIFLPEKKQFDQVIESIQSTATKNGVFLKEFSVSSDNRFTSGFTNSSIVLNLSAPVDAATNFMKELEKSLRLYDVSEISISRSQNKIGSDLFDIGFKINTYSN